MDNVDGINLDPKLAAYRLAVIEPAWGVVMSMLSERKTALTELIISVPHDYPTLRGRILELQEMMQMADKLRLEVGKEVPYGRTE